ncbi:MAG: SDR family oxidoreductase [Pseudomonadota bacterium]
MTKTILITGANRGIGLALADVYVKDGWSVIGTAREPSEASDLTALGSVEVMALDVANQNSIKAMADALHERPIDLLINNAGVMAPDEALTEVDAAAWQTAFAVNTIAPLQVTAGLRSSLAQGGPGLAVVVTSIMGSIENTSSASYLSDRASKAAANMVVRGLASDMRSVGVSVIAVHPGWVQTDMGGSGAHLSPAESAGALKTFFGRVGSTHSGGFYNVDGSPLAW